MLQADAFTGWQAIRHQLRKQLSRAAFELWFDRLYPRELSPTTLTLAAETRMNARVLRDERLQLLECAVREQFGPDIRVAVVYDPACAPHKRYGGCHD